MANESKRFSLRYKVSALGGKRGEVMIYSVIDTWKWGPDDPTVTSTDFDRQLKALGEIDELTIRINSPGGSVSEAVAIRTQLMKQQCRKIIDIEGDCASAATLIACLPGAKVRMSKGSAYMIHLPRMGARGTEDDMMRAYNFLKTTGKDMADIYAERTGKTADDCLELMKAETWYDVASAVENGFVDEEITGEETLDAVACAIDEETMELMQACYIHVPPRTVRPAAPHPIDSNGNTAVAAEGPSVNTSEGENGMSEQNNATAENPTQGTAEATQALVKSAVRAERERVRRIEAVTPPGDDYRRMAQEAKENGTSAEDFFAAVLEEQAKKRTAYAATRNNETAPAAQVTGGDSGDNDNGAEAEDDKAAREIAEMAKNMRADTTAQAYAY